MVEPIDEGALDTWLAEVELTHDYVKKLANGEISVEELDKKEEKKKQEEKKKKDEMLQKEQERINNIKKGRSGKGEKEDYKNFCRSCFFEFTLETESCWQCGKKTVTCAERREELLKKVDEYKSKKARREERKKKWELWKKTKSMLWKKTSTNYNKWDYFTDSSDEEKNANEEPILPKDDPNFRALEEDLNMRKKQREADKRKADELKEKGNAALKAGDYKKAVEFYSEGLEIKRDHKQLYTNRALAYNKLKKYSKAIADCTRLLEFCECFEKGYDESRKSCFKAFIRRSFAYKEEGNLDEAKNDIEAALKLDPSSKEAQDQLKEIDEKIAHRKKVSDLNTWQNEEFSEKLTSFLAKNDVTDEDIQNATKIIAKHEGAKVFFFENKGMEKCLSLMKNGKNCCLLINILSQENLVFQEGFLKLGGLDFLLSRIKDRILEKISQNKGMCDELEDIFEVLITFTRQEKIRQVLTEIDQVSAIFKRCFELLTPDFETEPEVLSSFFSFTSNLCFGGKGAFSKKIQNDFTSLLPGLESIISAKGRMKFGSLLENIYNFLANLLIDASFRAKFLHKSLIKKLIAKLNQFDINSNNRWISQGEALLAVFFNLTYQAPEEMAVLLDETKLAEPLVRFVKELDLSKVSYEKVLLRSTHVLSKLKYGVNSPLDPSFFEKLVKMCAKECRDSGLTGNALRVLIPLIGSKDSSLRSLVERNFNSVDELTEHTKAMICVDNEQLFCNSCLLSENICALWPSKLPAYQDKIERLLKIVQDKTGNMRKNAALFIGKLSKHSENLERLRALHGIEILHSVSKFILEK